MINNEYKQTEIGLIPEDWNIELLGNVGTFKNGINKEKEKFGYGVPIVGLMNIFGLDHIDNTYSCDLVDASTIEQNIYSVKKVDVLFVRSSVKPSGVGMAAVVRNDLNSAVFSGFLLRYRTNLIVEEYKRYVFSAPYFRKSVIAASTVSANTNINQENLKRLFITFPSNLSEQYKIAEALSDVDVLIASLEKLIAKKKAIKQGAMQRLLTGKTRLPGFEGEWRTIAIHELGQIVGGGTPSTKNASWWNGNIPWISSSDLTEDNIKQRVMTSRAR